MFRLAFRRETAVTMMALVMASAASVGLVIARILWSGSFRYGFLVWNLFLAWLPLLFAFLAVNRFERSGRSWRFFGLAGVWLLFFPNAPYIFTDLIHLTQRLQRHFWVDMVLILICALTGWIVGFVSLFLMHSLVARRMGQMASWVFVAGVTGLSGFGVYLGRFLRFNSWDVLFRPRALYHGIGNWASDPLAHSSSYAFPALFAVFLFLAYLMLYALTHLQHAQLQLVDESPES